MKELQVRNVPDLLANLDGLWHYFTEKWLRLAHLNITTYVMPHY
ncbi:MAG: hypothetical protein Q7U10_07620 [Thermodesulfovibrionia bacterium]|nr:hypothetical protein [Thermodesulfovibrionia bacterium]